MPSPRSVTLITGDRVVLSGPGPDSIRVQPGAGRRDVRFAIRRLPLEPGRPAHLYVIPVDAAPLIASGKVDRRLFDVTLLMDFQYDDAHRRDLPFIVSYGRGGRPQLAAGARGVGGAMPGQNLPSVNGWAMTASKSQLQQVWASVVTGGAPGSAAGTASARGASVPIEKLWLDGLLRPRLDRSVPQVGAPAAWALGHEGDGIVVAVLDTGVDTAHPDLIDSVLISENFTRETDVDTLGHGTHVASILAGTGAAGDGTHRGVAPGVQLLAGKVCDSSGCPESMVIAGMQWAVAEEGAQVVNISLGWPDAAGFDPVEEAMSTLTAQYGALFVVAAGNGGPSLGTIESPGVSAAALTVGAVDRDDGVAFFSGRGLPTGDLPIKPDLTAPGVEIAAARAAGTALGTAVGEHYVAASGTSMAAPHAAGAVALLLQQHPDWSAADAKAALMGSAAFNPAFAVLDQGAGRLDIEAALGTSFLANTSSLNFGTARWPHADDALVSRTVHLRNLGAAAELALELDVVGPGGYRPPTEMFALTPAIVSLPAGGTAAVTVTANTALEVPDGVYGGRLIASDGSGRGLAIPVALRREAESYDLILRHLDRRGEPTAGFLDQITGVDNSVALFIEPDGGAADVTLRLPRGIYAIDSLLYPLAGEEPNTALIAPQQSLASDTLLVLDASLAEPVVATAPSPAAEIAAWTTRWQLSTESGQAGSFSINFGGGNPLYYAGIVGAPAPTLSALLCVEWNDASTTPLARYAGAWLEQGGPVSGVKTIDASKVAVVDARYAASLASPPAIHELSFGALPAGEVGWVTAGFTIEPPLERTEYYYSDTPGMGWANELWIRDHEFAQSFILGYVPTRYDAGQAYTERWNEAPFSPALRENDEVFGRWASRRADRLLFNVPTYGDRQGHPGFIGGEARLVLYRDDELVGEVSSGSGSFDVPPEPASYRVELDQAQSMFELAPRGRTLWRFESAHVEQDLRTDLPLLSVRFEPLLDARGRAPAGAPFDLPFDVLQFGGPPPLDVAPTLEVSYDDGATWAAVPVAEDGERWSALLDHPPGAAYVSLRASARADAGNSVEQTLIRAYGLSGAR